MVQDASILQLAYVGDLNGRRVYREKVQLRGGHPRSHQRQAHRRRDGSALQASLPFGFFPLVTDFFHRRPVGGVFLHFRRRQRGVHLRQGFPAGLAGL